MSFIKNNKQLIIDIGIFTIVFLLSFLFTSLLIPIWCDNVWSFGFSYNISNGLSIYKDFNVLQTPLYFYIASIFIKIFGNYFISIQIFDSILIACISILFYKLINWKMIFVLLLLIILPVSQYNLLCLFFVVLIIYLINKEKDNDLIIPILVGLTFITKQNFGVLFFIPMFIYSKNKIKGTLYFLIPLVLLCIFYLIDGSLFNFIDYAFLGLFEFSGNREFVLVLFILELICFIYLVYCFIKSKYKDKELLYIILVQFALYPILDIRHFSLTFSLFVYYFIKNCSKYIILFIFCISEVMFLILLAFTFYNDISFIKEKNIFYLRNDYKASKEMEYLYNHFNGEINNIFIDTEHSYLLKLYYNSPISEFDFMFSGNMGHYNKKKIYKRLDDYCSKNECVFLIYKNGLKGSQVEEFDTYVKNNYKRVEILEDNYFVYTNKKDK